MHKLSTTWSTESIIDLDQSTSIMFLPILYKNIPVTLVLCFWVMKLTNWLLNGCVFYSYVLQPVDLLCVTITSPVPLPILSIDGSIRPYLLWFFSGFIHGIWRRLFTKILWILYWIGKILVLWRFCSSLNTLSMFFLFIRSLYGQSLER